MPKPLEIDGKSSAMFAAETLGVLGSMDNVRILPQNHRFWCV